MTVLYMTLALNDFDGGKSITRAMEEVGPANFQGPSLPKALKIEFVCIKFITSRAI
jgi:hypothetical protein